MLENLRVAPLLLQANSFLKHISVLQYSENVPRKEEIVMSNCETCMNYEYDEEYEYYVCTKNLDEDEMYRFVKGEFKDCPYYQFGDEYQIVRKQM